MFGWAEKLFLGVDLEEEQKRSNDLDAQRATLDQNAYADGKITQAELNRRMDENVPTDVNAEVGAAFGEGLKEGVDNVRGTIGDIAVSPFKLIDWRLYVIAAAALFFYMGGAKYLRGLIPKLAKK